MSGSGERESTTPEPADVLGRARRVLRRHLLLTGALVIAVLAGMLVVQWRLTRHEANQIAERVSARVAESVSQIATRTDFSDRAQSHAALDERVQGFIDAGAVEQIKVWLVEGDQVRVVYSDDRRAEGSTRAFSARLAERLDRGETVVLDVAGHRYDDSSPADLREAYTGFTDRAGHAMRLEVYVPVHSRDLQSLALTVQAPVIGAGLVALIITLTWGSVSLAGQLRLLAEQRQRAVLSGLRSRQEERTELAQRLHDGVVQSISGARLALDSVRGDSATDDAVLRRVVEVLGEDADVLRRMLTEYVPRTYGRGSNGPGSAGAALADDLRDLALADAAPAVQVQAVDDAPADDATAALVVRIAQEAVRNARRHAAAERIDVSLAVQDGDLVLDVRDDGRGMPPERLTDAVADGHVGLALMSQAVRDAGGELSTRSAPGAGTLVRARFPVAR